MLQTALVAAVAWYIARDVIGHVAPFFAPIAAAVCMWATNAVRAQLAAEMVLGVGLGIASGSLVYHVLGTGPLAMFVVVATALAAALLPGRDFTLHRPMFVNQTMISAILVLTLPHSGIGTSRLADALIGGGIAATFSLLIFPRNPLAALRDAQADVLSTLRELLSQLPGRSHDSGWLLAAAATAHQDLARLTEARGTAEQLARLCPMRWPLRAQTRTADAHAAQLSLLTASVLQLGLVITTIGEPLPEGPRTAVTELAAATSALLDDRHSQTAAHTACARRHVGATSRTVQLTATIESCIQELDRVAGAEKR